MYFKHACRQKQPPEVFCKNGVLRNLAKFIGKHLCQSLYFNKVAGLNRKRNFLSSNLAKNEEAVASLIYPIVKVILEAADNLVMKSKLYPLIC